jgi:hypothetical protein
VEVLVVGDQDMLDRLELAQRGKVSLVELVALMVVLVVAVPVVWGLMVAQPTVVQAELE